MNKLLTNRFWFHNLIVQSPYKSDHVILAYPELHVRDSTIEVVPSFMFEVLVKF